MKYSLYYNSYNENTRNNDNSNDSICKEHGSGSRSLKFSAWIFETMKTIELITFLLTVVAALLGLFGNLFIVIVTAKNKCLWTVTHLLLATLAVYDIILVVVCNPINLVHVSEMSKFTQTTPMDIWFKWIDKCDIFQGLTTFATTGHVLCMFALTLDRLFYILPCNKYRACMSKKICGVVISLIVVSSVAYPTVAIVTSPKLRPAMACWFSTRIDSIFNKAIWTPLLALTIFTFLVFYVIFFVNLITKRKNDVMKMDRPTQTGQSDHVTIEQSNHGNISNQSSYELQITWAIAVCIFIFIPSYLTNYVIITLAGMKRVHYPFWVFHVCFCVNHVHMYMNPIVYTLLHRDYRKTFKRFIMCRSTSTVHPVGQALVANNGTP